MLEDWLNKHAHPMIRLHTALSLLKILKHDVPARITQIILENLVGSFGDPDMYILGPDVDFFHAARMRRLLLLHWSSEWHNGPCG